MTGAVASMKAMGKAVRRTAVAFCWILLFLYSWANAALIEGRTVRGAVMVNPSGRQAVLAKTVVDATWDGRIAAAAGAPFDRSVSGDKTAHRYLLITHPAYAGGPEIAVPKTVGLLNDVVRVHDGGRVLDISAPVRIGEAVGLDLAGAECATRRLAMEAVGHLRENVKGFDQIDAIREQYPRVTLYTGNEVVFDEWPVVSCDPPLTPRGVQGLLVAGLLASGAPESFDLVALLKSGETAGRLAARMAKQATLAAPTGKAVEIREEETSGQHVREFLKGPDTGRTYPTIHEGTTELSIVDEVDVLVIGGGTAGAPAAIAAAQMGVRVAVLEILPFLGGTAVTTIHSYYAGVPYDSKLRAEIDAYSGASREKDRKGP
jgi:hypothetical protein